MSKLLSSWYDDAAPVDPRLPFTLTICPPLLPHSLPGQQHDRNHERLHPPPRPQHRKEASSSLLLMTSVLMMGCCRCNGCTEAALGTATATGATLVVVARPRQKRYKPQQQHKRIDRIMKTYKNIMPASSSSLIFDALPCLHFNVTSLSLSLKHVLTTSLALKRILCLRWCYTARRT